MCHIVIFSSSNTHTHTQNIFQAFILHTLRYVCCVCTVTLYIFACDIFFKIYWQISDSIQGHMYIKLHIPFAHMKRFVAETSFYIHITAMIYIFQNDFPFRFFMRNYRLSHVQLLFKSPWLALVLGNLVTENLL